eukprot:2897314-Rhodomonas_salina.1
MGCVSGGPMPVSAATGQCSSSMRTPVSPYTCVSAATGHSHGTQASLLSAVYYKLHCPVAADMGQWGSAVSFIVNGMLRVYRLEHAYTCVSVHLCLRTPVSPSPCSF